MRNPITRLIRYFSREYPSTSGITLGLTTVATTVATVATIASGGSLLLIPAVAGGITLFSAGFNSLMGETGRWNDGSTHVGGAKIVGSKRDVASIEMTQRKIKRITKKYKHLPELPANVQRKVAAHVKDIEPTLARIRAYQGYGENAVTSLSFTRDYYDARGRDTTQVVATALTMQGIEKAAKDAAAAIPAPQPVATPKPVVAETPRAIVVPPKPVADEFGKLAKKMDAMEKRIADIENPQPEALDKPKLSKPTA